MTAQSFIEAARCPRSMPTGEFGMWTFARQHVPDWDIARPRVGADSLMVLGHYTEAKAHQQFGDIVMEDSAEELRKHLPIWMKARGRVLVSGLGLGCVVRGLLLNEAVRRIDVVEISPTIMEIVGAEFLANPRVRLHQADALKIEWPADVGWDYAWHDIWTHEGNGAPLHKLHLDLLFRYRGRVTREQGAWALPREIKRMLPGLIG